MVNLEKERLRARKHLETLYEGTCNIYGYENGYNRESHSYKTTKKIYAEDVPCRLSYASKQAANQSSTVNIAEQEIFLYIAPEVKCCAGSSVEVTQNGVTRLYNCMGLSALYSTHQEVKLSLENKEA